MNTYTITQAFPWMTDDADVQIESSTLLYTQIGTGHGLQCNLEGQHENYPLILSKCQQIATLIREIESLNQRV